MKIEIDTESDEFRKAVEQSVVKSDKIQEQIEDILETNEIREILAEKVKKIIKSDEFDNEIKEKISEYISCNDIADYDGINEVIEEYIKNTITSKFK